MRSKAILPALAAATILLTNGAPVLAQSPTATLTATSTATCVRVGTDVPVTIALGNASSVSTVQATVTYDPTVFEVPTKPTIGASFPLPFRNETDTVAGKIEISASNSSAVNGSADFATITFRAIKSAATQIGFDQNASLVLTTAAENTNVLGTMTPLSLPSCEGTTNGNSNGSIGNTNTNGGFGNTNTNTNGGFVNVNTNGSNNSNSSSGASQCAQPTNFGASGQGSGIVLTWEHNDSRLSHFVVHYGRTQGKFDTVFMANNSNTLRDGPTFRLTLENVALSKTYYLAVSAMGDCAESAKTQTLSVQTASSAGTGGTSAGSSGGSGNGGGSYNGGSSNGTGSTYGTSYGGYGDFGSASVVNDGMTQKGAQLNYRLRGVAGDPATGPKEAMMVAILSALVVGGMWVWRRGLV